MYTEVLQSTLVVPQISPKCVSKVLKVFEDLYPVQKVLKAPQNASNVPNGPSNSNTFPQSPLDDHEMTSKVYQMFIGVHCPIIVPQSSVKDSEII